MNNYSENTAAAVQRIRHRQLPSEPGYYWVRINKGSQMVIARLRKQLGNGNMVAVCEAFDEQIALNAIRHRYPNFVWGPLVTEPDDFPY